MAANLNDVGIQSSALTLLESIDYSAKLEEAIVTDSDSSFGDAEAFNPVVEFSLKGKGDIPASMGIGTDAASAALTGINDGAGTMILTSVKESESNKDFNAWECSGTYWPNAI